MEQYYRWVKARERLPEREYSEFALRKDGELSVATFTKQFGWEFSNNGKIAKNPLDYEWLEPVEGKGETESKFDPFVQKHMNIFWEKLKEANIERFIKPMFGSLSSASISYFLETGRVNGGFLEALNKMMDVVWRLSKLHGEQNPDECDATESAQGDTADLQKQISELKSELEEVRKENERLSGKIDQLSRENETLEDRVNWMRKEINKTI